MRPTSVRAFVTGLPEICLLLLLLVKLERNDVIAGLAKALVYMYIYMIYIYIHIYDIYIYIYIYMYII